MMVALYIYSTIVTSIASGVLFTKRCIIRKSWYASFFIGISMSPYIQFVFTLIIALIFREGISRYVYIIPIPLAATVYLIRAVTLFDLKSYWLKRRMIKRKNINLVSAICIITGIVCLVFWVWYCYKCCITSSFIQYDNMEYFYKASYFANHRGLSDISYVKGIANGSALPDNHFPSYILYLGYAFMHSSADIIAFPLHKTALIASLFFMVPVTCFSIMGVFLCWIDRVDFAFLIPCLLWVNNWFIYYVYGAPRDLFRLCGLCIVLAYISNYLDVKGKITIYEGIALFIISFMGASAHILNSVYVAIIGASLFVYYMIAIWNENEKRYKFLNMVKMEVAIVFGIVVAFAGSLYNYAVSGRWNPAVRIDFSKYSFYDAYLQYRSSSTVMPIVKRWEKMLYLDTSYFGLVIVLTFIVIAILLFAKNKLFCFDRLFFLFLFVFLSGILQSGLVDTKIFYQWSYNFAKVPRYALSFYYFTLLFDWICISRYILNTEIRVKSNMVQVVKYGFSCFFLISTFCYLLFCIDKNIRYAYSMVGNKSEYYAPGDEIIMKRYGNLIDIVKEQGKDGRILVQQGNLGYITGENTLIYNSMAAQKLYENASAVRAINDLDIKVAVLKKDSVDADISVMPWYDYVTDWPCTVVDGYEVYVLK